MRKAIKIISIFLIVIAVLALALVAGFNTYQHMNYKEYYSTCQKEFKIPGLIDGFVPLGITYDEKNNLYLICGNMPNDSSPRVYYVDPSTNKYGYLNIMEHENGRYVYSQGDVTGIAIFDNYIFMTIDGQVSVFNKLDITSKSFEQSYGECLGDLVPIQVFDPQVDAKFIHIEDGNMYIGESFVVNKSNTRITHHIKTDSGDYNQAIMTVYNANEILDSIPLGKTDEVAPLYCYSITSNVQGMCILNDGNICISTSNGFYASHIKIYDDPLLTAEKEDEMLITNSGFEIPLYYLDSNHYVKEICIPPMSKELVNIGDRVVIMNKSASKDYIFGIFTGGKYCDSFIPSY